MCKTKLALFFEKLRVTIPTSWTPIIKGRKASSLLVLPLLLLPQLHPILQGLNFGQILAAPIFSSPLATLFLFVFPDYLLHANAS